MGARILIVGEGGSGKSMLAAYMAARLGDSIRGTTGEFGPSLLRWKAAEIECPPGERGVGTVAVIDSLEWPLRRFGIENDAKAIGRFLADQSRDTDAIFVSKSIRGSSREHFHNALFVTMNLVLQCEKVALRTIAVRALKTDGAVDPTPWIGSFVIRMAGVGGKPVPYIKRPDGRT